MDILSGVAHLWRTFGLGLCSGWKIQQRVSTWIARMTKASASNWSREIQVGQIKSVFIWRLDCLARTASGFSAGNTEHGCYVCRHHGRYGCVWIWFLTCTLYFPIRRRHQLRRHRQPAGFGLAGPPLAGDELGTDGNRPWLTRPARWLRLTIVGLCKPFWPWKGWVIMVLYTSFFILFRHWCYWSANVCLGNHKCL